MAQKSWIDQMRKAIVEDDEEAVRSVASHPEVSALLQTTQFWRDSYSPVNHATSRGRVKMIRMLVQEFGALVTSYSEYITGDMWTPLHEAVFQENLDCIDLLLELGADLTAVAKMYEYSGTPMEIARQADRNSSISALLKHMRLEDGCLDDPVEFVQFQNLNLADKPAKESELAAAVDIQLNVSRRQRDFEHEKKIFQAEESQLDERCRLEEQDIRNYLQELEKEMMATRKKLLTLPDRHRKEKDKRDRAFAFKNQEHQAALKRLQNHPNYRSNSEISMLRCEVSQLEKMASSLQQQQQEEKEESILVVEPAEALNTSPRPDRRSDVPSLDCPVCLEELREVYSCPYCSGALCEGCKDRVESCPLCRGCFQEGRVPVRNLLAERLIRKEPAAAVPL